MGTVPFGLQSRNFDISASSGNFKTTSGSFVSVTNLSVTLEVSGKTPVWIFCTTATTNGSSFWGMTRDSAVTFSDMNIRILRDVTPVGDFTFRIVNSVAGSFVRARRDPPSVIQLLELPPSGSRTYIIQVNINNSYEAAVNEIKLVAMEL